MLIPSGFGVEVGVGTGVFASELNTSVGLDLALNAIRIAKKKGIDVILGDAEFLPFKGECFDYVSSILTICFLENPESSFKEAWRILRHGGKVIICFIPQDSSLGSLYLRKKAEGHRFYKYANLYTKEEVEKMLQKTNFQTKEYVATLLEQGSSTKVEEPPSEISNYGFICIKAEKTEHMQSVVAPAHPPRLLT